MYNSYYQIPAVTIPYSFFSKSWQRGHIEMSASDTDKRIEQMCEFIKQEAIEKATEIKIKTQEEFDIDRQTIANKRLIVNVLKMDSALFLWIGTIFDTSLRNLSVSINSRFDTPSTSVLLQGM